MLLTELSERSGVSVASIKYYRREGLLPPGERVTATRQDYGETHLERLALISSLRQIVDAPITDIATLCTTLDDPDQPLLTALEIAQAIALGLPAVRHFRVPPRDEHPMVGTLLATLGWPDVATHPRTLLDRHLKSLESWGMTIDADVLAARGRAAGELAALDLDLVHAHGADRTAPSPDAMVTRAFRGMVANHKLTTTLQSLAQASTSITRARPG